MLLEESFRWFGPGDPVTPAEIRQTGASGVITSLHQIPYGHAWSPEAIAERCALLDPHGLRWVAAESLPVSEDIKTQSGDWRQHLDNYRTSLRNLGHAGIRVVIYNFMPVLDWVRTDFAHALPDGSRTLRFDPAAFAAFDLYLLQRPGAERDWSSELQLRAREFLARLGPAGSQAFAARIIDVFPGCRLGLGLDDIRTMLARYQGITPADMRRHLRAFLEAVVPVAEEAGVRLAIHPDDPPWPVLGLPRILGCEEDIRALYELLPSRANGLCLCAGSLSARADNDIPGIIRRHGDRIHVAHLRSTEREEDGCFVEAGHLTGSVDMYAVMEALLDERERRRRQGRADLAIPFRPDHGLAILDDLRRPDSVTPGYPLIGRMKGLAELRGLELGIARAKGYLP